MKRAAVVLAAVAVLAVVAALAFGSSGGGATSHASPTAFDLPALSGTGRVRLADFRGRPVVVNLFASWCAECRSELPALANAADRLRGRVTFIGIDSEETGDGGAMAREFRLADSGFVLGRDPGNRLHDALKAPGMPVTVFYDASGAIVSRSIASLPAATIAADLQRLYGL